MPALNTLHDLMVHQLKDLYSAERQLLQSLPKMARQATSDELQASLTAHHEQTAEHVSRLEECLTLLDETTRGPKCKGMEGLIAEAKELLEEDVDADVLDAGIIAAAQRVEHYEIAGYGTVCEYARVMRHTKVLQLLQQSLEEEKAADETLTRLAEGGIKALAERDGQQNMGADPGEAGEREVSAVNGRASGRIAMAGRGGTAHTMPQVVTRAVAATRRATTGRGRR